jgi:regulator of replication initiation timing
MENNKMMKAINERINEMQQKLVEQAMNRAKQVQELENQMQERAKLIESNKQMISDIESQITLMSICIQDLKEQKKGLLAENEDKMLEVKELEDKLSKDKFAKYISNITPSEEDTNEIKQVDTIEELVLKMSEEDYNHVKELLDKYKN